MTYSPPPDSQPPIPQPGAVAPDPTFASPPPPVSQPVVPSAVTAATGADSGYPPPPYPQQPGVQPLAPGWPGGPPPAPQPRGYGFAVLAMVLGLLGLVVPFLPFDMTGFRQYTAFPFAIPGVILAILGCVGPYKGKPLAVIGGIVAGFALIIGAIMFVNYL